MNYQKALIILINSGTRDIRGSGIGIRITTDKQREEVRKAIRILFPTAYGRKMDSSDEFNFL